MKLFGATPVSLRALVSIIGLLVAIITAIAIPSGFLFMEYSAAQKILAVQAQWRAGRLARYIYIHDPLWQYQAVALAELIEAPGANAGRNQQRVVDNAGNIVLKIGKAPAYPAMTQAAPIVVRGATVGSIEVSASARPLAIATSVVAALSVLLGFGLLYAARGYPLRVLARTLGEQNSKFDAALNNMSQGLLMFDAAERVVVCNQQYIEMYDLSPDIVKPGCTVRDLIDHRAQRGHLLGDPDEYRTDVLAKLKLGQKVQFIAQTADAREIAITAQPMPHGGWVVTHSDITERRKAEARIEHMAMHDALTNLPNRVLFRDQIEHRLAYLAREQTFAILCLDLDHFKNVNDTLGHVLGDELLRQCSERTAECRRQGDTIACLGGDEFAILQGGVKQPDDAMALADRLIDVTNAPFDLDGNQVVVGLSIGIAFAPTDAADPDQLLKNADIALYRAKGDGRGIYRFFESEMDTALQARRALELDLRKALVNGEFELYYQPLVNLAAEQISGFETLIRWNHPERGMVSPLEFIGLAEETALIVPIGEWVLRQACTEAMKWPGDIKVAVNLSPAQFKMRNLSQVVISALTRSGLPARRLELEITESVLLLSNESTLKTLHQLRSFGVRISMDDFGTGYSSLSYLRSFPFDKIKIDQSFVRDLATNAESKAIVRAVTALGNGLGMMTTGEGVETREEFEYLKQEGCTEAQGYFISKPRPAGEALKMLSEQWVAVEAAA
jgi:diguanylate cyclase (GGDEF)-like protein